MGRNTLYASNEDVQRFYRQFPRSTKAKKDILSTMTEKLYNAGKSIHKMFTGMKKGMLDELAFLLSGSGICTIGTNRLMEKFNASTRTVRSFVKSVKDTGEILVCRQLKGRNAGTYIFVLKSHPNFKRILKEVFFIDELPISQTNAQQTAHQVAHQKNAESLEPVGLEGENQSPNLLNSFISKQEKDIICESTNNDDESIKEVIKEAIEEDLLEAEKMKDAERVDRYLSTPQQKAIHSQIHILFVNNPLITSHASIFVLRASHKLSVGAMFRSLMKLDKELKSNNNIGSISAYFSKLYKDALINDSIVEEDDNRKIVPFYNWLDERE